MVPGSSATSRIYLRLINDDYGPRMPPTEPLDGRDRGHQGLDRSGSGVARCAGRRPRAAAAAERRRQPFDGGAAHGGSSCLRKDSGQDPGGGQPERPRRRHAAHVRRGPWRAERTSGGCSTSAPIPTWRSAGATALMWAVDDAENTKVLLKRGADANARSELGQTPLHRRGPIRLERRGQAPARPRREPVAPARARPPCGRRRTGDPATFRLLVERGAGVKAPRALLMALSAGCAPCADQLIGSVDKAGLESALVLLAPCGDVHTLESFWNAAQTSMPPVGGTAGPEGRTPLMLAAGSDHVPTDAVAMLIRGEPTSMRRARTARPRSTSRGGPVTRRSRTCW